MGNKGPALMEALALSLISCGILGKILMNNFPGLYHGGRQLKCAIVLLLQGQQKLSLEDL